MKSIRMVCCGGLTLGLLTVFAPAQDAPATAPTSQATADAEYSKVIAQRAQDAVGAAKMTDTAKADQARAAVESYYRDIHDLDAERDEAIKSRGLAKNSPEAKELGTARQTKAVARVSKLSDDLAAVCTHEESEAIKDKIVYNVRPITIAAYNDELPKLTDEQKKFIADALMEGRDMALTGGTSKEKHEWFGKYKGRIGNYLAKQGYDMKAEGAAWAERIKAAKQAK
ncbi:MAG: hypothetical protein JWM57_2801 [Phycisphaerales bacterium]|nr:hypothetical protein [Phycisphaerales bacterium]